MTQAFPILYSFRRCPYAMRARLALMSSGQTVELREIVLRDKAPEFVEASPKATVPVLLVGPRVIEESIDIMHWALGMSDPEVWLDQPSQGQALIKEADGPFKSALDRYKYSNRYDGADATQERTKASEFLTSLDRQIGSDAWLFGDRPRLADMAILPFVRQFAMTDIAWFRAQPWDALTAWLDRFLVSDRLDQVMNKYPKWINGDPRTIFPSSP